MICKHKFGKMNAGRCIGWTGGEGIYVCEHCLASARYYYEFAEDPKKILWIKDRNGKLLESNEELIRKFGDDNDLKIIGLKRKFWTGEIIKDDVNVADSELNDSFRDK